MNSVSQVFASSHFSSSASIGDFLPPQLRRSRGRCFHIGSSGILSSSRGAESCIIFYRVHTPFRTASARRAERALSCNRLLCSESQMAIGYARRTMKNRMGFVFCRRRAAMQELRATENWRRVVKRLKRIHRLRKIWLILGPYLHNYKALK